MNHLEYWTECVADAAEECGAILTEDQLKAIAYAVKGAHDNIGMAFHVPESPYPSEIKRLERSLAAEKAKRGCPTCSSNGRVAFYSGPWWVNTQCDTCNGEGKVAA